MTPDATILVFDGDQTLWDFHSALDRALAETRHEIVRVTGVALDAIPSVNDMTNARDQLMSDSSGARLTAIRRNAFRQLLAQIGAPDTDELLNHVSSFFMGRRYEMCRPYRETVPVLRALEQRYTLVLLSNGNSRPERIGLGGLFTHAFFAEDLSMEKPDPAIYEHVMATVGGDTFVSIGDSIPNDVAGPASHGWKTVWMNRDSLPLPEYARPDAILVSLDALDVTLDRILA